MASSIENSKISSKTSNTYWSSVRKCNKMCWRFFKWIPVLLILSIVTWSYFAYVLQLCVGILDSMVQKCVYLVIYHTLLILFLWSYWQTIFSPVAPIPDKYKLPSEDLEKLMNADSDDAQRAILDAFAHNLPIMTRTMSGAVRYCNRCVIVKPDRAHHCSICSRCVLKMDHHCPWVNNCVCFHNYKFFMLFLGYALFYCIFIMSTCLPFFIKFWKGEFGAMTGAGRYHVVFAFFVSLMFGISLGSLFGYHIFLVLHNRTTLESFRAPMFRGGTDKNGFSLGCFNNFKEIFGNNPKLWLLPVFTSVGDGCEYPVRREHQLETFTTAQDPQGYESMGTTRFSSGDGITFPLPAQEEDTESLLSSERWDRWGERARPFDDALDGSSYDEL